MRVAVSAAVQRLDFCRRRVRMLGGPSLEAAIIANHIPRVSLEGSHLHYSNKPHQVGVGSSCQSGAEKDETRVCMCALTNEISPNDSIVYLTNECVGG